MGCGAGVDTILAAMMAGPNGSAVGVDIVPEMIARAESNLKRISWRFLKKYVSLMKQMVAETGFNSSAKTKGTLFRATKAAGTVPLSMSGLEIVTSQSDVLMRSEK